MATNDAVFCTKILYPYYLLKLFFQVHCNVYYVLWHNKFDCFKFSKSSILIIIKASGIQDQQFIGIKLIYHFGPYL